MRMDDHDVFFGFLERFCCELTVHIVGVVMNLSTRRLLMFGDQTSFREILDECLFVGDL